MIRQIALVMALWTLAVTGGCTTMRPVYASDGALADTIRKGDSVKVGDTLELTTESGVQARGKVMAVTAEALTVAGADGSSAAIPIDDIKSVKTERFDSGKTVTGVALGYSAITLIGLAILIGATGATLSF